ncbi:MAG: triose-phosphate isomerase [Bryobacteraceae bacterium]|nr:triose-phosphate isomerase [Bryobacteraceae bacterium]MDW8379428.1 triose-phosphate isomerase [Bryobacterales bacterium]
MRKPLMAGNWKMYKTAGETKSFFEKFLPLVAVATHADVVICPPFVNIPAAVEATETSRVEIGAQNLYWKNEGAYTGEVSGPMIFAAGARWVIIGHSERRQYFQETDATVFQRTQAALACGLNPIVCVGETLAEREAGATEQVLKTQFEVGLGSLAPEQFAKITIAYEPVWAIGTGKTATPETAAEAHRFLRGLISAKFGHPQAVQTRILYGGSVKPENIKGLMAQPEIDGALVGGASLDADSFSAIVNF